MLQARAAAEERGEIPAEPDQEEAPAHPQQGRQNSGN